MPVTSRWLDEPPPTPPWRHAVAILAALLLVILTAWSVVAQLSAPRPVAHEPTAPTAADTEASLQLELPAPTAKIVEMAPAATPEAATVAATPACPEALILEPGQRAGWLARAAGCPDVLFATVAGERRWVRRPASLPDALYEALPEVRP